MMTVAIFSLFYWLEDRRRMTEEAITLDFTDLYAVLLVEKRIYNFYALLFCHKLNNINSEDQLEGRWTVDRRQLTIFKQLKALL